MRGNGVVVQDLIPGRGRQRLELFRPKLVELILEPPWGLVGREQNSLDEHLEGDWS